MREEITGEFEGRVIETTTLTPEQEEQRAARLEGMRKTLGDFANGLVSELRGSQLEGKDLRTLGCQEGFQREQTLLKEIQSRFDEYKKLWLDKHRVS